MDINELKTSLNEIYINEQTSQILYEADIEYSQLSEQDKQIIQETHFSKDDLQDPETIKKLEEKLKKKEPIFATIGALTGTLLFILSIILASLAGGATIAFMILGFPFVVGICVTIGVTIAFMPQSQFERDYKKFKDKVQKLKDKSQEKLDKEEDPSKKQGYKDIINNCDKVIKAIEKREKEIADKKFKEEVEELSSYYKSALNIFENPHMLSFTSARIAAIYFTILQKLGCKYTDFLNNCKKAKWSRAQIYINFDNLTNYLDNSITKEKIRENDKLKVIPEFKNNDKIALIIEDGDNDWVDGYIIYSEKANKFFSISYEADKVQVVDIFKQFYDNNSVDDDVLKEVDKEQGYYILSECPPGLIKKSFKFK